MKLTVFLVTIACLQLSAKSYSQNISFSGQNVTLEKVLSAIEQQSGYYFFYKYNELQQANPVTVNLQNVPVEQALEQAFKNQPLIYSIDNKIIVVRKKTGDLLSLPLQQHDIRGKVTDSKGEPLPGASVRVKGSSLATLTNSKGEFTLKSINDNAVLIITYTGFVTREVALADNQSEITITLTADLQNLKEVVVVGYGTQKRSDVTSAISTFKPNELNSRPVLGPDQMIQGKMAGVMVASGSGNPGSANRVSIRGIGSLSASNEPLYVIDGIPVRSHNAALFNFGEDMNPLSELNPNDIESIDVLKDAASAAIYGSRATNGVVLITTKSGKKGKSRLSVDTYTGIQQVPYLSKLKMADSKLYVDVINEAIDNYNLQYGYEPGVGNFVPYITNPYPGLPDTNWLDLVLRTAKTNSANVSFSGGSDKGTYYVSGSYLNQDGAIITNNLKKYTGKINLSQNVFSWLQVGANTNFSFSHNNRIPGSNLGSTVLARGLEQRPFDRPYKPNGSYYVGGTSEMLRNNSIQILNEEKSYLDNHRFLGNFFADINFSKNLTFRSTLGTDIIYTHDYVYYNENHPYGTGNGRLIDNTRLISNLVVENTLTYKKQFNQLNMELLAGHSYQKLATSTNLVDGNGFPSSSFDVNSVAATISNASTGLSENALESYFARANFSYNSRYLLALSMRADGSSRFAPEKRVGYFPSVSAGWDISKEDFWKPAKTDLKLRASYGSTGNQEGIGNYAYQALAGGGYNYNNSSGLAITNVGNANLTWESAHQFDGGFDLGINNGKFRLTADYFVKNTTNLLYEKPTAATTGFTSVTTNVGSMRNWGYEFGLNANVNLGPVSWASDFNISFIKNKLTSLIGDDPLLIGANRVLKVGEEVGSFYIYKQLGIYQYDSEVPQSLYNTGIRAGDVKYDDVDNNGAIDVNDRQVVGSSNPDFFGGWNNTFQYRNFDFSFAVTYSYGAEIYAPWRINVSRLGGTYFPFLESEANGRWTGPGTSNTIPRAISGNTYNTYNSTRYLEDGSYLRMRYVSLGYNLPKKMLTRLKLERLRVYVQADNLFLLTRYSGIDPEVSDNLDPKFIGDDNLVMPQLRSFNLGINLTF
ncbi:TonB-dependent receptor (plasmid) [Pedobacter sp. BS3]|uniref:TonB-dependent receptor n=1 Tax=Pedobacter sp. BS3 TaxID=2567937 RepID=UPI0011F0401F|nr:TonB-dependent receptor [Pedobacter sp. BS3]TZF86291.1 TonB-dependent receptor [Pedobacter sp. BS3]